MKTRGIHKIQSDLRPGDWVVIQ